MVEDTKMTDAEAKPKEEEAKEEEESPQAPPLQAAGVRLERLLSDKVSYTNPAKVVRRWLTTSSGAAGTATLADIGQAAQTLLRPTCPEHLSKYAAAAMETNENQATEKTKPLLEAALPFEAWLVSLAVRCLYKDGQVQAAFALAQQGMDKATAQLQQDIVRSTSTALYPLLARLVRWRALLVEQHLPQRAAVLRTQMAQAYNMACLRRDADTQATLLNCMLRDLLHSSQSESW